MNDFLALLTDNQRALVTGLFRAEADKKKLPTVHAVVFAVMMQLFRRSRLCFSDQEGDAYISSMQVIFDEGAAVKRYVTLLLAERKESVC